MPWKQEKDAGSYSALRSCMNCQSRSAWQLLAMALPDGLACSRQQRWPLRLPFSYLGPRGSEVMLSKWYGKKIVGE